jgi:hypothetical protein
MFSASDLPNQHCTSVAKAVVNVVVSLTFLSLFHCLIPFLIDCTWNRTSVVVFFNISHPRKALPCMVGLQTIPCREKAGRCATLQEKQLLYHNSNHTQHF